MKDIDKLYSQLQARCHKCNDLIHSVNLAKCKVDKNENQVILCLDCANKYKEEFRDLTKDEIIESMFMTLMGIFIFGKEEPK